MEEKLLEEKLNEVLEDKKVKLEEEKQQINDELSKFKHVIVKDENGKYAKSKEELELLSYLDKAEKEIKEVEKEKKTLSDFKNMKDNEKSLLKAKQDLEKEMKTLEGKYEFRDGKMIKPKELEMYENEYEEVVKKLSSNSKKKVKLEKATTKMYEKYGIHQAVKKDIDKAWEEALKENEQREIDKAWAEAIKENKERETTTIIQALEDKEQRVVDQAMEETAQKMKDYFADIGSKQENNDSFQNLEEPYKKSDVNKEKTENVEIVEDAEILKDVDNHKVEVEDVESVENIDKYKDGVELDNKDLKIKLNVRKNSITVHIGNKTENYNLKQKIKQIKQDYAKMGKRGKDLFKERGMGDLIPIILEDIDEKYGTTRAENFEELFYFEPPLEGWGNLSIDFDLRNLYKIINPAVPKMCRGKLLDVAKQYRKLEIADVKMGIRTGTVDKIKTLGRKLKNISQEFLLGGKKVQSLGEPEKNLEEVEIEENTMDKYKVDNKDNKIEETARQNMEKAEQTLEEREEEFTK